MKKPETYLLYFSAKAKKDIQSISRYTFQKYGRKQAEKYYALLAETFDRLLENPELYGHRRTDIPEKYKACRAGEHSIIYRIEKNKIYIVTVLHGHMNFIERLK
jgi:toxin ParE1/3/4